MEASDTIKKNVKLDFIKLKTIKKMKRQSQRVFAIYVSDKKTHNQNIQRALKTNKKCTKNVQKILYK